MIIKFREIPLKILLLEALLRRTSVHHSKRQKFMEELARSYAGFRGEESLDYFVAQLPDEEVYIFQNLRLPHSENSFFQIDLLVLTLHFFIIFESKNIAGNLYFDLLQLVRTFDGKEEVYPDPILQVENQQYHLNNLMRKYIKTTLPGTSFVVVTNSTSKIEINPQYKTAFKKVMRTPAIPAKYQIVKSNYQKEIWSKSEISAFSQLLLKLHTPEKPKISDQFHISDLLTGIYCDICEELSVKKSYNKWICTKCESSRNNAHIKALMDYCILIGSTITTQQCKNFLQLSSISIASKLLRSLNLPFSGSYRNRVYHLDIGYLRTLL